MLELVFHTLSAASFYEVNMFEHCFVGEVLMVRTGYRWWVHIWASVLKGFLSKPSCYFSWRFYAALLDVNDIDIFGNSWNSLSLLINHSIIAGTLRCVHCEENMFIYLKSLYQHMLVFFDYFTYALFPKISNVLILRYLWSVPRVDDIVTLNR